MEQLSAEWFKIRQGKLTASHAQAIAANGKGLRTYVIEVMAEYFSIAEKEPFSNANMVRGIELEPEAVLAYIFQTGFETKTIGFVEYNKYIGCSPDLLVEEDGLGEIKCPIDKTYFNYMVNRKIDTKYIWQMQMQMFICKKKWCDYIVYNPNFKQNIIIQRVLSDKKKVLKILKGIGSGIRMIRKLSKQIDGKEV